MKNKFKNAVVAVAAVLTLGTAGIAAAETSSCCQPKPSCCAKVETKSCCAKVEKGCCEKEVSKSCCDMKSAAAESNCSSCC